MHDPESYQKVAGVFSNHTRKILYDVGHLLKWRGNECKILDVGCGEGTTTVEALEEFVVKHVKNYSLVGVDILDSMVEASRQRYGNRKNVTFERMDIGENSAWIPYQKKFHHIFSVLCMHYISDQRTWISNLYNMLEPCGQIFLVLPSTNPLLKAYIRIAEKEKWSEHQKNRKPFDSPFLTSKEPMSWLTPLLEDVGFRNIFHKNMEYTYEVGTELAIEFSRACKALVEDLPRDMGEEFLNALTDDMTEQPLLNKESSNFKYLAIIAEK